MTRLYSLFIIIIVVSSDVGHSQPSGYCAPFPKEGNSYAYSTQSMWGYYGYIQQIDVYNNSVGATNIPRLPELGGCENQGACCGIAPEVVCPPPPGLFERLRRFFYVDDGTASGNYSQRESPGKWGGDVFVRSSSALTAPWIPFQITTWIKDDFRAPWSDRWQRDLPCVQTPWSDRWQRDLPCVRNDAGFKDADAFIPISPHLRGWLWWLGPDRWKDFDLARTCGDAVIVPGDGTAHLFKNDGH